MFIIKPEERISFSAEEKFKKKRHFLE